MNPTRSSILPRALAALLAASALVGCEQIEALIGGGPGPAIEVADGALRSGDLPGAADGYIAAAEEHPDSVEAATGAALSALMMGDTDRADQFLEAVEGEAGEALGEVKLRRALVALEAGDVDAVGEHARASGLPAGYLLAAEVALADGEREDAAELLAQAQRAGGIIGETADAYLALIEDDEPLVSGLSEAQALWALGEQKVAVRSVEELVKNLPESQQDRESQQLLWAGRAASVGETEIATSILDTLIFAPEGQTWRKVATQAIIACAEGDGKRCLALFQTLEGKAPETGLADARATAAYLIARQDAEVARALAGPYVSAASARALVEAGDLEAARESAPAGVYARYLGSGG